MPYGIKILAAAALLVGALVPGLGHADHCDPVTATPDSLWPPNHKLHTITLTAADPSCDVDITSVTQDQAVDGKGSGHTIDFDATNCVDDPAGNSNSAQVDIRAERSGLDKDGRTYAIMWTANGDHQSGTVTVHVAHDQRKNQPADADPAVLPSGAVC